MSTSMAICLAEDRLSEEEPIRLCVASVCRSNPDCPIITYLPNASKSLQRWLATQPTVELRSRLLDGKFGWNVKPYALMAVMESGFDCVWWIDSDVIVRRPLKARYGAMDAGMFLATEEALSAAYDDNGLRARGWGFELARHFGHALNSGVMRVSRAHAPLLLRWRKLLESAEYRAAQKLHWRDCPLHLLGDQDVLTALLCSREFADVPVRVLGRGRDIVQYYGGSCYTLRERLGNLVNGGPTFVHSQGFKPWRGPDDCVTTRAKAAYRRILSDTSIYLMEAHRLRGVVEMELSWTRASSTGGRMLRFIGFGNNSLTGLPLAAAGDAVRLARWTMRQVGAARH